MIVWKVNSDIDGDELDRLIKSLNATKEDIQLIITSHNYPTWWDSSKNKDLFHKNRADNILYYIKKWKSGNWDIGEVKYESKETRVKILYKTPTRNEEAARISRERYESVMTLTKMFYKLDIITRGEAKVLYMNMRSKVVKL